MGNIALWRVPGVSTRPGLAKMARDPLLRGANGGALFGFDTAFSWSYDPTTPPANAKQVRDLAEIGNGDLSIREGQALGYAGGGLDFTGATHDGVVLRGPAGALADLQDHQEFAWLAWMKLPTEANWNAGSTIAPIFTTAGPNSYTAGPDLLTLAQTSAKALTARRQTNGGATTANLEIGTLAAFYGQVTQILFARTASETLLQMRTAGSTVTVTGPAGALNTGNLSALRPQWGVVEGLNNLVDGSSSLQHRAATAYRLYRGYLENFHVSGRNPLDLADLDWQFRADQPAFG